MVVVEDLISTGGSVLDAVAAAEREGADVIGVVAIFTYELPKAEKKLCGCWCEIGYSFKLH